MVPRLHNRGAEFRRACWYILHDIGKASDDRVLWAHTANLGDTTAKEAWRLMEETWKNRTALKRAAGVDLRGRDNKTPVLHLSLAWAKDEQPSADHMKEAALSALKALKLEGHQAVMAAHADKDHLHIHIIVNTVHPETGRTAPLKHSKLELSKWAEAYEREHGIKCEQRIKNNEERAQRRNKEKKKTRRPKLLPEQALGMAPPPEKKPPRVRDRSPPRRDVIEKNEIIDRLRRHRAEIDHRHFVERDVLASRHRDERAEQFRKSEAAATVAIDYTRARFKSRWRDLFEAQRKEAAHLGSIQGSIFERAAFVFWNSERLGGTKPLSFRQKVALITSPTRLFKTVERMHERERTLLSSIQKAETKHRLDRIWSAHNARIETLRSQHAVERAEQRQTQKETEPYFDYRMARAELAAERASATVDVGLVVETDAERTARLRADMASHRARNIPQHVRDSYAAMRRAQEDDARQATPEPETAPDATTEFNAAAYEPPAAPTPSRAELIKSGMAEYRQRNPGHDMGREFEP